MVNKEELIKEIESYNKDLYLFEQDNLFDNFVMTDPKIDGIYLTIYFDKNGIHQQLNEWKYDMWCVDKTTTIFRSLNPIKLKNK